MSMTEEKYYQKIDDLTYDILQNEGIDGLTRFAVFYAMVEDVKDTFNYAEVSYGG